MGPRAALVVAASTTFLFSLSLAVPFDGPAPTLKGRIDDRGITPKPTDRPLVPQRFDFLEKREIGIETCAYLEGQISYPWICPNYYTCATDRSSALGCCPLGNAGCTLAHTCYESSRASLCDTQCVLSEQAVVCNDPARPYCGTIVNNALDKGTLTILECVSLSDLSINAILTPTASDLVSTSSYGYDNPNTSFNYDATLSDILATLSSELSSLTAGDLSYSYPTSIPPYLSSILAGGDYSIPSNVLTFLPTSLQSEIAAQESGANANSAGSLGSPDDSGSSSGGDGGGGGSNVGAIAGGVVGGIAGLALIIGGIVAFLLFRRRKANRQANAGGAAAAPGPAPGPGQGPYPPQGQYQPVPAYQSPQADPNGPYGPPDSTYSGGAAYMQGNEKQHQNGYVTSVQQQENKEGTYASHEADSKPYDPNTPNELAAPHNPQNSHSPTISTLSPSAQGTMSPSDTINSNELPGDTRLGPSGPINNMGQPVYEMGDGMPGNR